MTSTARADAPLTVVLKALKLLASGQTVKFTAAATNLPDAHVERIAESYGWPDDTDLKKSIRQLQDRVAATPATTPPPTPTSTARTVHTTTSTSAAAHQSTSTPSVLTVEQLLDQAQSATPKHQRLAARISRDLEELRHLLTEDTEAAKLRAKLTRLTEQLVEVKKELEAITGKPAKVTSACDAAGVTPDEVRTWALAAGIAVRPSGRIPGDVVAQYVEATR